MTCKHLKTCCYFVQNGNAVQSIPYTCYIFMPGVICLVQSIETYVLKHECSGRLFRVESDVEYRRLAWFMYCTLSQNRGTVLNTIHTWSDNKVRELIAVKVLHTSLLNTTVVAFKVLPLGSHAPMPAPNPLFKTILELVLWNGLQCCRCCTPDVINVIKMLSFQYFLYLREQKKVTGG